MINLYTNALTTISPLIREKNSMPITQLSNSEIIKHCVHKHYQNGSITTGICIDPKPAVGGSHTNGAQR